MLNENRPHSKSSIKSELNNKKTEILNLCGSSSEDEDQENMATMINSKSSKKKKKKSPDPMDQDHDDEIIDIPPKAAKKKSRKRKLEEADLIDPPPKKRKTSSSTNSNSKKKASKSTKDKKKEKKTNLKGNDAIDVIRDFMLNENRPHSKSSIKSELNAKKTPISDGQIQKALDALSNDDILTMKEFGKKTKTKIYWRNQDGFDLDEDGEDEKEIIAKIKKLEFELKEKKKELNGLKKKINDLGKEPTNKQIQSEMISETKKYNESQQRLQELQGNNVEKVSEEELNEKLLEFYKFGKAWKERKGFVMDMISKIFMNSNNSDKWDKILVKQMGGETDKENGVDWSDYKQLFKLSGTQQQRARDKKSKR